MISAAFPPFPCRCRFRRGPDFLTSTFFTCGCITYHWIKEREAYLLSAYPSNRANRMPERMHLRRPPNATRRASVIIRLPLKNPRETALGDDVLIILEHVQSWSD